MGMKYDFGKCCDCGKNTKVKHYEWSRASAPRCSACGGRLEPTSDVLGHHANHRDTRAALHTKRKSDAAIPEEVYND